MHEYNENEIVKISRKNYDEIKEYFTKGYKPCSSWYEKMVKKLKYDRINFVSRR